MRGDVYGTLTTFDRLNRERRRFVMLPVQFKRLTKQIAPAALTHPQLEQHEKWVGRYGRPDALPRWRSADPQQAPNLAFLAVASDARMLLSLDSLTAHDLAGQAERVARQVCAAPETIDLTRAAANVVTSRVEAWRKVALSTGRRPGLASAKDDDRHAGTSHPALTQTDQEVFKAALGCAGYYREPIARRLAEVTLGIGSAGLLRLSAPMDAVLALGAARFAAQSVRLRVSGIPMSRARCLDVIEIVQEWGEHSGKNPFFIDFDGKEQGEMLARQAVALAADACICATIAAGRTGGTEAPGFGIWEAAEEFHAYAVLSINSRFLTLMDYDKAQLMASAASRFATAAIANPDLRVPRFPSGTGACGPKSVLAMTASLLGQGIRPRRSAASMAFQTSLPSMSWVSFAASPA